MHGPVRRPAGRINDLDIFDEQPLEGPRTFGSPIRNAAWRRDAGMKERCDDLLAGLCGQLFGLIAMGGRNELNTLGTTMHQKLSTTGSDGGSGLRQTLGARRLLRTSPTGYGFTRSPRSRYSPAPFRPPPRVL